MSQNGNGNREPSCRPARPPDEVEASASSRPVAGDVPGRLQWLVSAHLDVDPARLQPEVRLGPDLCVDSLAAIELTMVIEDEFDISLPEEDVADVRTYGDILALVSARAG
ncbi:MAG: acyl carrier protein [Acidimicrobiales bacterium]